MLYVSLYVIYILFSQIIDNVITLHILVCYLCILQSKLVADDLCSHSVAKSMWWYSSSRSMSDVVLWNLHEISVPSRISMNDWKCYFSTDSQYPKCSSRIHSGACKTNLGCYCSECRISSYCWSMPWTFESLIRNPKQFIPTVSSLLHLWLVLTYLISILNTYSLSCQFFSSVRKF